jgi:phosphoribosylformylglycinamidine synthase PurS subunit
MKAKVYIRLKQGVLDPQGKAVLSGLRSLGFEGLEDVRVGKLIEIKLAPGVSPEKAREEVAEMCRKLLANTVIEDFSFDLEQ